MRWFLNTNRSSGSSSAVRANSVVIGPVYYNQLLYGTKDNPAYQMYFSPSAVSYTANLYLTSGYYIERYAYFRMVGSPTDESLTYGTEIENAIISGKYQFRETFNSQFNGEVSIPLNFVLIKSNGETQRYNCIRSAYSSTGYNRQYCGLTFANVETSQSVRLGSTGTSDTTYTIPDEYKNFILDFGSLGQDIPKTLKDYIELNATQIYDGEITVKSKDGSTTYDTITGIPEIKKCSLTTLDTNRILNCEGINGLNYTIEWESPNIIDGKYFVGLSFTPNSNIINIPNGRETTITLNGSTTLYEVYGTVKPILTSFELNLYNNTAESNRLDKTDYITPVGTLNGAMRDESSITDMTIVFESDSIPTFNYVYIPIFNRYYFVNDISTIRYKLWEISLTVDTLMTYKEAILACQGFVDRNEFASSPYIIDNKRVVKCGNTTSYTVVQNELFVGNEGWYVLNGLGLMTSSVSVTNLDEENGGDENA